MGLLSGTCVCLLPPTRFGLCSGGTDPVVSQLLGREQSWGTTVSSCLQKLSVYESGDPLPPPPPTNGQTCSALFWASGLIISLHWYHSYWLESTLLEFVDRLMKRLYAMALPEYTHHQRTGMGCRVCPNLPRPNRKPSGVRVKHSLAEMLLLFSQGRVKISKYTWHMQTMNHSNRSVRLLPA